MFGGRPADQARRGTPADLLVVGLGNPGPEFAGSRHNVGADAVARLAQRHQGRLRPVKGIRASADEVMLNGARVALAVPSTYMNDSGAAIGPLLRRFGIDDPGRLVVVHDELDLPPGRVRIKEGGGTAGHNGLKSIQAHLHSLAFIRVRIGVGKPPRPEAGADYVLKRPGKADRELLAQAVEVAADAVEVLAATDVEQAMNRFNSG